MIIISIVWKDIAEDQILSKGRHRQIILHSGLLNLQISWSNPLKFVVSHYGVLKFKFRYYIQYHHNDKKRDLIILPAVDTIAW